LLVVDEDGILASGCNVWSLLAERVLVLTAVPRSTLLAMLDDCSMRASKPDELLCWDVLQAVQKTLEVGEDEAPQI
jgi:hypothetical protein